VVRAAICFSKKKEFFCYRNIDRLF